MGAHETRNHQSSFRRSNRRNETELSKYIWTLQDSNKPFQIKWKWIKCISNMKSVISSHNKNVLSNFNSSTQQPDTCNCRKKPDCPLEGECLQSNVIYQATVTTAMATATYVGLATNFKESYRNHQSSLIDVRTEEMKRNSQNIFGLYKTLTNLSR